MNTNADPPGRPAIALANLLEQTARHVYDQRGAGGLHPVQWSALRFFARANRSARSVAGLARYLGVTLGPASRTVGALRRHGLVDAVKDPADGRASIVSLTAAGRHMLQQDPIHRLARAIEELPDADAGGLGRALTRLSTALREGESQNDDAEDRDA
ncbi:MarR family winged helix-turn-helix transcriptional regulator [Minwuia thermotolerans]|uniref:MarR family transcriptional regulator n=1 Tax=Minwuia thermotolerans TaxID=2056226 RepID=A0A2M9G0Q2_9PROT|nr:MarR family transcriptional regulator [Minwuia thermotolerans]PJK29285.1 MarR family transcriptional regulator [Minwuia thermotolerans]